MFASLSKQKTSAPSQRTQERLRGTTFIYARKKSGRLFALYRARPRRLTGMTLSPAPSKATFRAFPSRAALQPVGLPSLMAICAYSSFSAGEYIP